MPVRLPSIEELEIFTAQKMDAAPAQIGYCDRVAALREGLAMLEERLMLFEQRISGQKVDNVARPARSGFAGALDDAEEILRRVMDSFARIESEF
jgi:hypothetical protein